MSMPIKQTFTENGEFKIGSFPPGAEFMFEWDGDPNGATVSLLKVSPTGVTRPYKTQDNSELLAIEAGDTIVAMTNGRGFVLLKVEGGTNPSISTSLTRLYKDVD